MQKKLKLHKETEGMVKEAIEKFEELDAYIDEIETKFNDLKLEKLDLQEQIMLKQLETKDKQNRYMLLRLETKDKKPFTQKETDEHLIKIAETVELKKYLEPFQETIQGLQQRLSNFKECKELHDIKEMLPIAEDMHKVACFAIVKAMLYENAYVTRDRLFEEETKRNEEATARAKGKGFNATLTMADWRKVEYEDPETITFIAEQKFSEFVAAWNESTEIIMNERRLSAEEAEKRKREYLKRVKMVSRTLSDEPQSVQEIAGKSMISVEETLTHLNLLMNINLANQCKDGRWTKHGNQ